MTLAKETFLGGVKDVKIFPITADSASAYTVGTGIDVPGAKVFDVDYEIDEKELLGDEDTLDIWTKIKKINVSVEYSKLNFDLEKALLNGVTSTSGSAPNQVQKQGLTLGALTNFFQVAFKTDYVDKLGNAADCHTYIMKCKVSANKNGNKGEDFATFSFDCKGINSIYAFADGRALQRQIHETAADLTAIVSA